MNESDQASHETGDDVPEVLETIASLEMANVTVRVRRAAFNMLLESRKPVDVAHIAKVSGLEVGTVVSVLDETSGRVERDDEGRVIGIAGLTISQTHHRITIDGAVWWTWCALDAIGILGALSATGVYETTDPETEEAISIGFETGVPQTDAHLFVVGDFDPATTRQAWCPNVNIFSSHQHAELWAHVRRLAGQVTTVSKILNAAAALWLPLLETSTGRARVDRL